MVVVVVTELCSSHEDEAYHHVSKYEPWTSDPPASQLLDYRPVPPCLVLNMVLRNQA